MSVQSQNLQAVLLPLYASPSIQRQQINTFLKQLEIKQSMMLHIYNPSTGKKATELCGV